MGKTAVVFGATGLIGGHLLQRLLNDPEYHRIIAVARRNIGVIHPKIQPVTADLYTLEAIKGELAADCFFCCLGTTRKQTPDLDRYYAVDHDYPVAAAKIGNAVGAKTFVLVSAVGANPESANFYIKMKGETERDVISAGMERVCIFRPSLLTGRRKTPRFLERLSAVLMTVVNPLLLGRLSRFRSIPAEQVAVAMAAASHRADPGVSIYYWRDIKTWQ